MVPRRHANATTTPEMREFIRNSDLTVAALARLLNISEATVRKWKQRETTEDAPHVARHLQTTMTPVQEYVVVELRKSLLLSLDELLQITQNFINPEVSRSGLARCLKRHSLSRLSDVKGQDIDGQAAEESQRVHLNVEHLPTHEEIQPEVTQEALAQALADGNNDAVVKVEAKKLPNLDGEQGERCLFIANDPESRWVYVDIFEGDAKQAALRYISHVLRNAPFHIRRILAGNYNEFMRNFRVIDEEGADNETSKDEAFVDSCEAQVRSCQTGHDQVENQAEIQVESIEQSEY